MDATLPRPTTGATRRTWLTKLLYATRDALPAGRSLPDSLWQRRHRFIVALLWVHAVVIVALGLAVSNGLVHSLLEAVPVVVAAWLAMRARAGRSARAAVASFGLITASAMLVHLSGGKIEVHFHFFVALAIVALYEDWAPFLVALIYVVLEHGIVGVIAPASVYNHSDAIAHPWRWAAVHGGFVAAASLASIVHWGQNEQSRMQEHAARDQLATAEARYRSLVEQVPVAIYMLANDEHHTPLYVSPRFQAMLGFSAEEWMATPTLRRDLLHPDDRERVIAEGARCIANGATFRVEYRLITLDRRIIWVHDEVYLVRDERGQALYWHGCLQDITERKALQDQLVHQAFHDPLTGLPNRALFGDRLDHAVRRSQRDASTLAVLFIDMDNFKVVNDSLGHKAGDELVTAVARRLQSCVRSEDSVARLGGDEYTVLIEGIAGDYEAIGAAERIATRVAEPIMLDDHEVVVSASIGIALGTAGRTRAEDLLRNADLAMYAAKEQGKARYALFTPAMNARAWQRLALEAELRRALDSNELRVYYQPIVKLRTGHIEEVEALVRWEHPERGLVPPDEFIRIAEETGLIGRIGEFVLREAARQVRAWQRASPGAAPLLLSVNLSARQFQQPGLVEMVRGALADTGFDPHYLKLEITESFVMEASDAIRDTMQELRDLGIQLAIDDFGIGYSSLAYLKRFPVDILKIDRSFVDGLGRDIEDQAIVSAVIAVAASLNLHVTAEGIETAEQVSQLTAMGCEQGQGYFFARPLPAADLTRLLTVPEAA